MKITSEITGKEYTSVKECIDDERKFNAQKAARDASVSKEKKELSKAIEDAEAKVTQAQSQYDVAKQKAKEIIDKANEQAQALLSTAQEDLKKASAEKLDAIVKFNEKFGAYKVSYTGDRALQEFNKAIQLFDELIPSVFRRWF